jgi:hypothetical protein
VADILVRVVGWGRPWSDRAKEPHGGVAVLAFGAPGGVVRGALPPRSFDRDRDADRGDLAGRRSVAVAGVAAFSRRLGHGRRTGDGPDFLEVGRRG